MTTPTKAKTKAQLQADYDKAVAAHDKTLDAYLKAEAAYDHSWGALDEAKVALNNYQPKKKLK